ncbi:site-specific integrase [Cloacibacillus sp. An23]|uniref:tyrosine-type recombinase/integrase n=1 Tax=Cloacibacillus sp. An23 TaxID=1965591 RepID=UPI000B3ACD19|nr:site-specific integrase [Cloacibacillus sp. An23]OUO92197.1 hypothetical protein B5F39_11205 [Cloacibacillus sp. An23]
MPTVKLTQSYINSLPVPEKGYWILDETLPCLRLYVGKHGKTYYLKYKNSKGKSDSYKIGDEKLFTPTQARETAKKFLAEMAVAGTDIKRERKKARGMTVRDLIDAYVAAGGSQFTVDMITALSVFFDREAESLTPIEIETWRTNNKKVTGNKDSTINKQVGALKTILNFGVDRELIDHNPVAKIKKLKEIDSVAKTRYLTEDERARLLAALNKYDIEQREARRRTRQHEKGKHLPSMEGWAFANYFKPVILLSLNTGIRRHALLSLRWDDVDLEAGTVTLRAETAKSKKTAVLPLNSMALNVLRQWHAQRVDGNPLVFPSPQTGGIMDNCDTTFARLLKEAGITNFRWHDMRHDFASRLVMAGVDLNTVRELMTHSDIKMTLRYAHLAPEKMREAVEKIT